MYVYTRVAVGMYIYSGCALVHWSRFEAGVPADWLIKTGRTKRDSRTVSCVVGGHTDVLLRVYPWISGLRLTKVKE